MVLNDRVALVTGASHRVGKEIALTLAREGVHIGLHYHASVEQAQAAQKEIVDTGVDAVLLQGDFAHLNDVSDVVAGCIKHFSTIDILINNAAVYFKTPLGEVTESDWQKLLDVNLRAAFFCSQDVARHMKQRGSGKIINITDVSAGKPWADYIPYCISKAGLIAMTKGLAIALAPDIQVNAIASGTVLMSEGASDELTETIRNATLLKKIGSPGDIANTVKFLLAGSDYITGSVITVDGGTSLA